MKKKMKIIFVIFGFIFIFQSSVEAGFGGGGRGNCGNYNNYCMNITNYYGSSWGTQPSYYPYPQLPFQSLWPQQYYFTPHAPSPYQSSDCPFCDQIQMYQQQQTFPGYYQHPGGGAS